MSSTRLMTLRRQDPAFLPPLEGSRSIKPIGRLVGEFGRAQTLKDLARILQERSGPHLEGWHLFYPTYQEALGAMGQLSERGIESRVVPLPARLFSGRARGCFPHWPEGTAYWVFSGSRGNAVTRLIQSPWVPEQPSQEEILEIHEGVSVEGSNPTVVEDRISQFFGQPISFDDIRTALSVGLPNYRLRRLQIVWSAGEIGFSGEIVDDEGYVAHHFCHTIPAPPPSTGPWIASAEELSSPRRMNGLARRGLQRWFSFLYRIGLDAVKLEPSQDGYYVWPHLGFDFGNEAARGEILAKFQQYIDQRGISLSAKKKQELGAIRHAWELADFVADDGDVIGRAFLLSEPHRAELPLPLRFDLHPSSPGWGHLFERDLPPEWSGLSQETQEALGACLKQEGIAMSDVLTSEKTEAFALVGALRNWMMPVLWHRSDRIEQAMTRIVDLYQLMIAESRKGSSLYTLMKAQFDDRLRGHLLTTLLKIQEVTGKPIDLSCPDMTGFPYQGRQEGSYQIPGQGMTVAVLGDVGGKRTAKLAAQGHKVIHIDRDPVFLGFTQRAVSRLVKAKYGRSSGEGKEGITYLEGDWYKTTVSADYVEVFYPLSSSDVVGDGEDRRKFLEKFLREAVHSKLGRRGQGKAIFIVSEVERMIRDLAAIIREDPGWELLEVKLAQDKPPIRGGYNITGGGEASWMIYR